MHQQYNEFFKTQSSIKITIHPLEEVLNFFPDSIKLYTLPLPMLKFVQIINVCQHLVVGMPLLLRTLCHSSGVSLPSPFLSARVNIFRICSSSVSFPCFSFLLSLAKVVDKVLSSCRFTSQTKDSFSFSAIM